MGSFNIAAGKGSSCQILSTTTGGHRTLLAGTRSRRGATLYRHLPTSAVITTVEVIGKTLLQSRDLYIASRPRSLLHCGNDLLVVSAYKAGRAWSTLSHYSFHLAPDRLTEEDPEAELRETRDKILETTTNGPSGGTSFGFESITTSSQPRDVF